MGKECRGPRVLVKRVDRRDACKAPNDHSETDAQSPLRFVKRQACLRSPSETAVMVSKTELFEVFLKIGEGEHDDSGETLSREVKFELRDIVNDKVVWTGNS